MFSFIRIGVVLVFLHINTNPKIPLEPQSHSKLLSLLWCCGGFYRNHYQGYGTVGTDLTMWIFFERV